MKKAYIITGLGFGDETKGATVDLLCRRLPDIDLVVRHNGGGQAAHNVVTPDDVHHTFSQFGSGSFVDRVRTLLSQYMVVNPVTFLNEWDVLSKKGPAMLGRVFVDERALLTTPFHVLLNRARENARGSARHGTTGMGIGETVVDAAARGPKAFRVCDLYYDWEHQWRKLEQVRDALMPEMEQLGYAANFKRINTSEIASFFMEFRNFVQIMKPQEVEFLMRGSTGMVFEGAQGVMLDEDYGFHPHTTWSRTTAHNAEMMLHVHKIKAEIVKLGLTRTYCTRHGAGPMSSEKYSMRYPEPHNGDDGMAGQFRQGVLDVPMLKYAIKCNGGIDKLVVSHADIRPLSYISNIATATPYPLDPPETRRDQEAMTRRAWTQYPTCEEKSVGGKEMPKILEDELEKPVAIVAKGPTADDREILEL
jgi:adenylosuccinate synthase